MAEHTVSVDFDDPADLPLQIERTRAEAVTMLGANCVFKSGTNLCAPILDAATGKITGYKRTVTATWTDGNP
jgi:hypothetical protein